MHTTVFKKFMEDVYCKQKHEYLKLFISQNYFYLLERQWQRNIYKEKREKSNFHVLNNSLKMTQQLLLNQADVKA